MSVHSEFMALLSLTPALRLHDGTVPAKPAFPYVLVQGSTPRANGRSAARTPLGGEYRYRTTIVSLNAESVRIVAGRVARALEGARVAGARVEAVPNDQPIMEDLDVTINSAHPSYAVLEWRFTTPSV